MSRIRLRFEGRTRGLFCDSCRKEKTALEECSFCGHWACFACREEYPVEWCGCDGGSPVKKTGCP